ncbi:glycosyltransferase [Thiorhodococcus fuscus]|uniref:Glycosyltransferase n=1 Tax=Thiorhodococcus fuscus TaxID=527200 RepID=A0ABW4YB12_9GAMM
MSEEHKPRVLFLAKVYPYPPAVAGDAVYSRGVIEAMSHIARMTVLCADSASEHQQPPEIIWHVVDPPRAGRAGSVLSRWPLIAWKGATRSYHTALDQLLKDSWDIILLDNLGTAHALPKVMRYRDAHPGMRLVYVSHEYEYPMRRAKYDSYAMNWPKRLMAIRDLQKVRNSEERLLRHCDIVTVINTNDIEPFRLVAPGRKYLPIPPGYDGPIVYQRKITEETPRRVLILGGRRSEQKRQILLEWMVAAYDRLTAAGIEMVIAGDMDETLSQQLRKDYPEATVLGFVDALDALFASARMGVIADTLGGGFKLRLLTQVFQRLPIIGLRGAISGLPTDRSAGYLDAPDLPMLVNLVCDTMDDLDRLNSLHNRAFADCAAAFSWQARAEDFAAAVSENPKRVLQ